MDYQNGKIYRIVCEETGRQYIGSTCSTLVKRFSNHKRSRDCTCKDFINPKIILIEDYPCDRKEQLLMRERYHMENTECVNLYRPIITKEEKEEKYIKYKLDNKDRFNEFKRQRKICECGSNVSHGALERHKKTAKHKRLLGGIEL